MDVFAEGLKGYKERGNDTQGTLLVIVCVEVRPGEGSRYLLPTRPTCPVSNHLSAIESEACTLQYHVVSKLFHNISTSVPSSSSP